MATKKKATKKTTTRRTKAATPKKATPKKADEANRVFAIRVTDAELAAIHKAAGPRNATRFIRATAAAFASGDEKAFRAVVTEARAARS